MKNIRKSRILTAMALLSCSTAFAQSPRTHRIDSVSITSSRVPVSLSNSARIVSVLDSTAISGLPAVSINDVLKYAAGVDVRQRGDMGVQTDISVRGGTSDQIAIFLNGINICDPQTGHNAADFPVDPGEIDRIEILSGPAGVAYGSSSLLGAVNIVTKTPESDFVKARVEGGSYGYANAGIGVGLVTGKVSNSISANILRSDGFSRNSQGGLNGDYKAVKAFYSGRYSSTRLDLDWQAGVSDRAFGSNTFYSPKFDDQFEHTLKTFASLRAETKGTVHLTPTLYWNRTEDRFELFRGAPDKSPFNHHRTNVFGAGLNAWVESAIGKTAAGFELRHEDIISTNLGEPLAEGKPIPGTALSYGKGLNRTNHSIFLEHNLNVGNFSASAGIAAIRNTGNDEPFRFYPGANAALRFADNWKAYVSYNSSLRMPTFTELYYSVGGHSADKNLKAEKMQSVEGGLRYSRAGVNLVASAYYNHGSDLIDWIKDKTEGDDAQWKSVNYTRINSFGQEISLRMDFQQMLLRERLPLKSLELSYSHIDQDKELGENILSKYALEYLRHKFVARADFRICKGLTLNATWRWQDRVGNYERYDGLSPTGEIVPFSPYSILDAGLYWSIPDLFQGSATGRFLSDARLYIEANNLLDVRYFDYGNIPQPGIMVKGGLSLTISSGTP